MKERRVASGIGVINQAAMCAVGIEIFCEFKSHITLRYLMTVAVSTLSSDAHMH
jgi:hypothetical protein